jgi:hypothetical protein
MDEMPRRARIRSQRNPDLRGSGLKCADLEVSDYLQIVADPRWSSPPSLKTAAAAWAARYAPAWSSPTTGGQG